jgi:TIR domain
VHPFVGGENIAQFVAYAASVERNSSSPEAIHRIGLQLGAHTTKVCSIRRISAPLLGAGAGGLPSEVVVANLSDGFRQSSHKDASLIISVRHDAVFQRIKKSLTSHPRTEEPPHPAAPSLSERPPRVFISYSHSSPEHEEWVMTLGEFLRENGVDARLDAWHLRRGMDLPQFMTNELTLANRVILVSDEKYAEKADGRVGGVGWETMIVQGDVARLPPESTKYLVVVRSQKVDDGLPQYLKTKFIIHWPHEITEETNRRLLLKELFDAVRVPPIGARPTFL